jgi:hypothetical protein
MTELITDSYGPGDQPLPGIRLTGWKEIATYLDKAVRTVQRWERDFDLPVRRVSDDRVSSVYAFSTDLDDWLRSPSGARARGQHATEPDEALAADGALEPETPTGGTAPSEGPRPPGWQRIPAITWALAAAVVVLIALVIWREIRPSPAPPDTTAGKPASWRVEDTALKVLDSENRLVFEHHFDDHLADYDPERSGILDKVGLDDLEGDGSVETRFISAPGGTVSNVTPMLSLFNEDGSVRWTYQFSGTVRFGRESFGPPWAAHGVFTTPSATPGQRDLWVASIERATFPSVLQRLDIRTGKPLSTYWSNGYISSLARSTWKGKPVVLVGASFNEAKTSSLAVLDLANPNGSAPARQDKYRCADCPPGEPLAFVVFPKPARFASLDESGTLYRIDVRTPDSPVVRVVFAGTTEIGASVIYRLDKNLNPVAADTADGYLATYEALVRDGRIPRHLSPGVDPDKEFFPLLHWVRGAFERVGK